MNKGLLLASASGLALVPGALVDATPANAQNSLYNPTPMANWEGFYVGVHLGANWQQVHATNSYAGISSSLTDNGVVGGGQIGFNWLHGNLLYGLEADISWLNAKPEHNVSTPSGPYNNNGHISWLSTIRARLGIVSGDTMAYVTGGFAFGHVDNTHTVDNSPGGAGIKTESGGRWGWVVGGGVSHMWTPNLTISAEALFVDLGNENVASSNPTYAARGKVTQFSNQAVIGRLKLNYKF